MAGAKSDDFEKMRAIALRNFRHSLIRLMVTILRSKWQVFKTFQDLRGFFLMNFHLSFFGARDIWIHFGEFVTGARTTPSPLCALVVVRCLFWLAALLATPYENTIFQWVSGGWGAGGVGGRNNVQWRLHTYKMLHYFTWTSVRIRCDATSN